MSSFLKFLQKTVRIPLKESFNLPQLKQRVLEQTSCYNVDMTISLGETDKGIVGMITYFGKTPTYHTITGENEEDFFKNVMDNVRNMSQ